MISAKFLWGNILSGGKQQVGLYAKNSNFEIFESALYTKSVSMPFKSQFQFCVSNTSNVN